MSIAPLSIGTQMLYPTTISPQAGFANTYVIPNSNLFLFPFTLEAGQAFDIKVLQAPGLGQYNQDHSVRIWVTDVPGNGPVVLYPTNVSIWHANRVEGETVTAYDSSMEAPEGKTACLPLVPGDYFISIQNLANQENIFTFDLTELV